MTRQPTMTPTTAEPPPNRKTLREPTDGARRYLAEDITGEAGADEAAARAAGMLPAELLQPGEIIILLLKPSAWFILLAPLRILTLILVLAILAYLANGYMALGYSGQNIALAAMALMLIRIFWQFLEWLSRVYVLTDRRIITVAGVIRVLVFETPLEKIQHTNMIFSLRERLFALGTLSLATAGTAFSETYWLMLSSPLEVHQKVVQTLQRYRR
jgi:uncharacterized membrane protein YdbT with pleckstrin-like domain